MRLVLGLLTVSLLGAASVVQADVWTWKDSAGETHYSDRPVEGAVRVKTTNPKPGAGASEGAAPRTPAARSQVASLGTAAVPPRDSRIAKAVQDDVAKKREEQCKTAKAAYEQSVTARRLYKPGKDGEREYLSDAEMDQIRLKNRQDMDEVCGPSQAP